MTKHRLPERANLEQLKKQAKTLLHEARNHDTAALQRFHDVLAPRAVHYDTLALHDAQFVVAREYGFKSWNDMREQIEERSLSFAAAVDEFVRCATGGAKDRALRLLARHQGIAHANLFTELVLGDAKSVNARLQQYPELATQAGGVQNWQPLLYVCHTCLHRDSAERANGLVAIARELLRLGADPNAEYHWNWHPELPRTTLWGALIAMEHFELAEVLLESGANPTDGVSMHIAAGSGNLRALELLNRFGVNANGIPGGVPPLRYLMGWASPQGLAGVRWLLEHGADPNLTWAQSGDAPLHIAAQRWDVAMVELLVAHGADIHQRRADGRTAHSVAALHGNQEIAAWLVQHGAADELSPLEHFISACTSGNREQAKATLSEHPHLADQLRPEHHLMMHVPAERGETRVLETMLECGFDPNVPDADGVMALHRAAMAGRAEAVRVLLAHGASVDAVDKMFSASPLVWACEGWSHDPRQEGADHVAVARLLLAAGCPRDWVPPEKAPDPEGTQEKLEELCRAAEVGEPV